MTIHQCPKCELRFAWKTEVDDHCAHDHPEFRHQYPAVHHVETPSEPLLAHHAERPEPGHLHASQLLAWTMPKQRHE